MTPFPPLQPPARRSPGLTEEEISDLRLAAEKPLWRYILADKLFRPIFVSVAATLFVAVIAALDFHHNRSLLIFPAMILTRIAIRTCDWFPKRRLGRQLGYG